MQIPEAAVEAAAKVVYAHKWEGDDSEGRFVSQRMDLAAEAAREALEAALPYLAPAADGGLRQALEKLVREWQYTGEPVDMTRTDVVMDDCADELKRVLAAAPAVPQPVDREALAEIQARALEEAAEAIIIPGASSLAAAWLQGRATRLRNEAADLVLAGEQEQVEK